MVNSLCDAVAYVGERPLERGCVGVGVVCVRGVQVMRAVTISCLLCRSKLMLLHLHCGQQAFL